MTADDNSTIDLAKDTSYTWAEIQDAVTSQHAELIAVSFLGQDPHALVGRGE